MNNKRNFETLQDAERYIDILEEQNRVQEELIQALEAQIDLVEKKYFEYVALVHEILGDFEEQE